MTCAQGQDEGAETLDEMRTSRFHLSVPAAAAGERRGNIATMYSRLYSTHIPYLHRSQDEQWVG